MGYSMRKSEAKFSVRKENFQKALEVLNKIFPTSWRTVKQPHKTLFHALETWDWEN